MLAAELTGHFGWVPDTPGQCCILVALLCLAEALRARSRRPGAGVWPLTLVLLAATAGTYRVISPGNYRYNLRLITYGPDPHLIRAGLIELLILAAAAALVAADATRAQAAGSVPPSAPHLE